jgi:lipopolysaccharide transport system ATP-binding protein
VAIFLYTLEEVCVFNVASMFGPKPVGMIRETIRIPGDFLNTGAYYLNVMLVKDASRPMFRENNAVSFEVDEGERIGNWFGRVPGAVRPKFDWTTEVVSTDAAAVAP